MDHDPFGAFSKATANAEQRRVDILASADLDGDGELSNKEFEAALTKGGLDPQSKEFKRAIDGDGVHDIFKGRAIALTRTTDGKNRFVRGKANHCTDFIGCVLFLACWLIMVIIAIYARQRGDLYSLYKGRDKAGDYCGVDNNGKSWITEEGGKDYIAQPYVFYPGMDDNNGFKMISAIQELSSVDILSMDPRKLGGICVPKCPSANELLPVHHLDQATAVAGRRVSLDYSSFFGRCFPTQPKFNDMVLCMDDSGGRCTAPSPIALNTTCDREQADYQLKSNLTVQGFANISSADIPRYVRAFQRAMTSWMVLFGVGPEKSLDYEQVVVDLDDILAQQRAMTTAAGASATSSSSSPAVASSFCCGTCGQCVALAIGNGLPSPCASSWDQVESLCGAAGISSSSSPPTGFSSSSRMHEMCPTECGPISVFGIEFTIDGILDFAMQSGELQKLYQQVQKAMLLLQDPVKQAIFLAIFAQALGEEGMASAPVGSASAPSATIINQTHLLRSCSRGKPVWKEVDGPAAESTTSRAEVRKAALEWERPSCCGADGRFQPLLCDRDEQGAGSEMMGWIPKTRHERIEQCRQRLEEDCSGVMWATATTDGAQGMGSSGMVVHDYGNDGSSRVSWTCQKYEVTDATFESPLTWQSDPMQEQFNTVIKIIGFTFADCIASFELVMFVGLFTFIQGMVWLAFACIFVRIVVYVSLLIAVCLPFLLAICCFAYAGMIEDSQEYGMDFGQCAGTECKQFGQSLGYFCLVVGVIIMSVVCAWWDSLRVAIGVMSEAAKALIQMPSVLFFPLLFVFCNLIVFVFGLGVGGYILSIPVQTTSNALLTNITSLSMGTMNSTGSAWSIPGGYIPDWINAEQAHSVTPEVKLAMLLIFLFGVIWTMQVIEAVWICTISGAVGDYYWRRDDKTKSEGCCDCCAPCLRLPCSNCACPSSAAGLCCAEGSVGGERVSVPLAVLNLWKTLRYHFGSVCLSTLFSAVLWMAQLGLIYIDYLTKKAQEHNRIVRATVLCLYWCCCCIRKCTEILTNVGLILVMVRALTRITDTPSLSFALTPPPISTLRIL
jgi:choline transporter-like protein 2/4/5